MVLAVVETMEEAEDNYNTTIMMKNAPRKEKDVVP